MAFPSTTVRRLFNGADLEVRSVRRRSKDSVAAICEAYRQGASLEQLGARFELTPGYVRQLLTDAGEMKLIVKPALAADEIETRKRQADTRVREMYELYERGVTLAQVGEKFGLTRERVRQLFKGAGLQTRTISSAAALKDPLYRQRAMEVIEAFRNLQDIAAVAREFDMPREKVTEILRTQMDSVEYAKIKRALPSPPSQYTDEQLFGFLREACKGPGIPLTGAAYKEYAKGSVVSDRRPWPSVATYARRFDSWRAALLAAGVSANPPSPAMRTRVYDTATCVAAVRAFAAQLGRTPTCEQYDAHASEPNSGLPSSVTVRLRCGSWSNALDMAGL